MKAEVETGSVRLVPDNRAGSDLLAEMAAHGLIVSEVLPIRMGQPTGFASTLSEELGLSVRLRPKPPEA